MVPNMAPPSISFDSLAENGVWVKIFFPSYACGHSLAALHCPTPPVFHADSRSACSDRDTTCMLSEGGERERERKATSETWYSRRQTHHRHLLSSPLPPSFLRSISVWQEGDGGGGLGYGRERKSIASCFSIASILLKPFGSSFGCRRGLGGGGGFIVVGLGELLHQKCVPAEQRFPQWADLAAAPQGCIEVSPGALWAAWGHGGKKIKQK